MLGRSEKLLCLDGGNKLVISVVDLPAHKGFIAEIGKADITKQVAVAE